MPIKMSLVIDNPKINNAKNNNALYNNQYVPKTNLPNISMDLKGSMISRVYKAKQGCSSCGK